MLLFTTPANSPALNTVCLSSPLTVITPLTDEEAETVSHFALDRRYQVGKGIQALNCLNEEPRHLRWRKSLGAWQKDTRISILVESTGRHPGGGGTWILFLKDVERLHKCQRPNIKIAC